MHWTTPDFQEISLSGEVTAYVNTDDVVRASEQHRPQVELVRADDDKPQQNA
jgi:coenzyme PQQ precursor peptide PqqA